VGPRAGLVAVEKRKFLTLQGTEPGRLARSPSLYGLSYTGYRLASRLLHASIFRPRPRNVG
jgi:hypothetical protein